MRAGNGLVYAYSAVVVLMLPVSGNERWNVIDISVRQEGFDWMGAGQRWGGGGRRGDVAWQLWHIYGRERESTVSKVLLLVGVGQDARWRRLLSTTTREEAAVGEEEVLNESTEHNSKLLTAGAVEPKASGSRRQGEEYNNDDDKSNWRREERQLLQLEPSTFNSISNILMILPRAL